MDEGRKDIGYVLLPPELKIEARTSVLSVECRLRFVTVADTLKRAT